MGKADNGGCSRHCMRPKLSAFNPWRLRGVLLSSLIDELNLHAMRLIDGHAATWDLGRLFRDVPRIHWSISQVEFDKRFLALSFELLKSLQVATVLVIELEIDVTHYKLRLPSVLRLFLFWNHLVFRESWNFLRYFSFPLSNWLWSLPNRTKSHLELLNETILYVGLDLLDPLSRLHLEVKAYVSSLSLEVSELFVVFTHHF